MNQPQKYSRRRTILFVTIIFAAFFGFAEVASYLLITNFAQTGTFDKRHLEHRFNLITGWEPTPNSVSDTTKSASPHPTSINVDGTGNSITPLSWEKPQLKIVVTGGSTMFGVGSSNNAMTVPSLLERKIYEQLGIKAEVTNIAVRGYQSFQEAMRLREYFLENRADLVLAVSGRNDAMRPRLTVNLRNGLLPEDVVGSGLQLVRAAELQKPIVLHPDGLLREYSYFFDLLARAVRRLISTPRQLPARQYGAAIPQQRTTSLDAWVKLSATHYRLMAAMARSYDAEFLFVLQPTAYSWDAYPAKVPELIADRKTHDANRTQENAFYRRLLRSVSDLPNFELTASMNGLREGLYIDNCHYTDAGADILSDALLRAIEPRLRTLAAANSAAG